MARTLGDRSAEGIFNIDSLTKLGEGPGSRFLVEGLIRAQSVNIVTGNSNLGKTPLMVTLAVAVASGTEFLDLPTQQGDVFICDLESDQESYLNMLIQISKQAELAAPPTNIDVWSPNWDATLDCGYADALMNRLQRERPALAIIDPLRSFFPEMEKEPDAVVRRVNELRKLGIAIVFVHHLRKMAADAGRLIEDAQRWMQNVAGSHALINGTDLRLGVEAETDSTGAIVLGGLLRGRGPIPPIHVIRDYDEVGEVLGYRRLLSLDLLKAEHRDALARLPELFGFADAQHALPTKGASATAKFLTEVVQKAGVVKLGGKRGYRKPGAGARSSGALALAA
jgi:hypothetical protein